MSAGTIERIIGAGIVVALLGFSALFIYQGADEHVDALIVCALGIVAYVVKSPRDGSKRPSLPPGTGALLMLLVIAVSGCGPGAYAIHYRANTITSGSHAAAGVMVDAARDEALDRVEREHPTDPEHDLELDREAARWRPIGVALDAVKDAIKIWLDAIDSARAAGGDPAELLGPLLSHAARVVLLYDRVVTQARELGVGDLPPLPESVRALVTAIAGDGESSSSEAQSTTGGV